MSVTKIVSAVLLSAVSGADNIGLWKAVGKDDNCAECTATACTLTTTAIGKPSKVTVCAPYWFTAPGAAPPTNDNKGQKITYPTNLSSYKSPSKWGCKRM